jgi:hypothetical protein
MVESAAAPPRAVVTAAVDTALEIGRGLFGRNKGASALQHAGSLVALFVLPLVVPPLLTVVAASGVVSGHYGATLARRIKEVPDAGSFAGEAWGTGLGAAVWFGALTGYWLLGNLALYAATDGSLGLLPESASPWHATETSLRLSLLAPWFYLPAAMALVSVGAGLVPVGEKLKIWFCLALLAALLGLHAVLPDPVRENDGDLLQVGFNAIVVVGAASALCSGLAFLRGGTEPQ